MPGGVRLCEDAYDALGAAAERAEAAMPRNDLMGPWLAAGRAAYAWSDRHSAEYALIFGSPVPGYDAPPDTIGPAGRFTGVLRGILADARSAGAWPQHSTSLSQTVHSDIEHLRTRIGTDIEAEWLAAGLRAWTGLIGMISFIRFGHLHNVVHDHNAWFDDSLTRLGRSVIGT